MTIQIITEDGTNVSGANSFVTIDEVRVFAANRSVMLSLDDDVVAAQLIKSSDYLESFASEYKGAMTYPDQSLQWPRTGVYLYDNDVMFPVDAIPRELKSAQCALVISLHDGVELMPTVSASNYVTEETVGPLTTKYSDPLSIGVMPTMTAVEAWLDPLLEAIAGSALRTVRV